MTMINCSVCGGAVQKSLKHEYQADLIGAPFDVILLDAISVETCLKCGTTTKTIIPDLEGLLCAIASTRAVIARKLSGKEIKFLRHSMGWKAKEIAEKLEMSAENWSRIENDTKLLGPQSEKLFRIFVIAKGANKKEITPSIASKVAEALNLKIEAHWNPEDVLRLRFVRCTKTQVDRGDNDNDDGVWLEPKAA